MLKALEKRPVSVEAIENAITRIMHNLRSTGERELSSRAVGEEVMKELRHSAVIFDELHTYSLEYQRRLYDELTIPPTRVHGVRWITSYAGFTGESKLLEEVWNLAQAGGLEPGILPIYYNQGASLLALIDQGELSWRMPWTTPEYMKEVQASERPKTYRRLWLNEWVASESAFLPPGAWEACRDVEVMPLGPGDRRRAVFGLDACTARDTTALVGCL